ncbi:uncharacterized protein C8Q71DRAFT_857768 [Rhodofomes roseus]|uniref:DUF7702 domain-containing protein n=1 Tax=Rhodofomes roseus TaxID=34475 RepID=A0ABQ8KFH5_9APHY|nr:uncharacterized protein C8Q71DRAFT_857768 [Rhodofomes roseus]KAH9836535.1 hypothetical protein C8Q71DRAFT_857768 [Rhodofomes roseus]
MTIHLNPRGDIAVGQIVAYLPVLAVAGFLVARHGISRKSGWIFLVIVSLVRIVGGATEVASQQNPSDVTLATVSSTLTSAGVSPLLLATIGFLTTVCENTLSEDALIGTGLRLLSLLYTLALAIIIFGGVKMGNAKSQSELNTGTTLRHVGAVVMAVLFVAMFLLHLVCWSNISRITKARRTLLAGISAALPFLLVRIAYTVLSAFAPYPRSFSATGQVITTTSESPLAKFNTSTGSWQIYLLMSVLTEYATVVIYSIAGTRIRMDDDRPDYVKSATVEYDDERYRMGREQWPGARGQWGR